MLLTGVPPAAHMRTASATSNASAWGGSQGSDVAASPFSQVPENAAAVLQSMASAGSGGVGEAVVEARRALRSVQDVMQSVVESAQVS